MIKPVICKKCKKIMQQVPSQPWTSLYQCDTCQLQKFTEYYDLMGGNTLSYKSKWTKINKDITND